MLILFLHNIFSLNILYFSSPFVPLSSIFNALN
ncbi:hypothetical protein CoNPh17_CDS0024 [Staphylococcus phage S-CoN_Ph17]|nr:hypothetical protein CoNPh17_CDS0024 [Staphylococcus phage S-CoN_Ph17]